MNVEDCSAHQVASGDQVWRSDAEGRGFVEAVGTTLAGKVAITWHDGETTEHRRSQRLVRAVRKS